MQNGIIIFRSFKNGRKIIHSTRTFLYVLSSENVRMSNASEVEYFKRQIIASLPQNATEIEKCVKYVRNLVF